MITKHASFAEVRGKVRAALAAMGDQSLLVVVERRLRAEDAIVAAAALDVWTAPRRPQSLLCQCGLNPIFRPQRDSGPPCTSAGGVLIMAEQHSFTSRGVEGLAL